MINRSSSTRETLDSFPQFLARHLSLNQKRDIYITFYFSNGRNYVKFVFAEDQV